MIMITYLCLWTKMICPSSSFLAESWGGLCCQGTAGRGALCIQQSASAPFLFKSSTFVTPCTGTQTKPLINILPTTHLPFPVETTWKKPQDPVVLSSFYFSFSPWEGISDPGRSDEAKAVMSHRNCLVRSCPYLSDPTKFPGYSAAKPYSAFFSNIWYRDTLALTASAPEA